MKPYYFKELAKKSDEAKRTTAVYTLSGIRDDGEIVRKYKTMCGDFMDALITEYQGLGVAVAHPEDEFVKNKGLELASRRAENEANRKMHFKLMKIRTDIERFYYEVNDAICDLNRRFEFNKAKLR